MLDQCHYLESKIQAQIRSVLNVQETLAKTLLVDREALADAQERNDVMEANAILREALADAQERNDVMEANAILMDAFWTDVRPGLAALREERGLPADPCAAFRASA